jgi:para-aminobenzoate synthetase component 2
MKVLLVDAYDSFVYIIYQYLEQLGLDVEVCRNDLATPAFVHQRRPDFIVLGPGPGHPAEAGYVPLITEFKGRVPILGVCLGHQAIGLAFGGQVIRASHLMHGKTSVIRHDGKGMLAGVPNPARVTRYHSLLVADEGLPGCLEVSARSLDDNYIMAMRHREFPIESVQFHPESIYTENGLKYFGGFFKTNPKADPNQDG